MRMGRVNLRHDFIHEMVHRHFQRRPLILVQLLNRHLDRNDVGMGDQVVQLGRCPGDMRSDQNGAGALVPDIGRHAFRRDGLLRQARQSR